MRYVNIHRTYVDLVKYEKQVNSFSPSLCQYYISGAVNRFLRPEPTNNGSSDPNSSQESAVSSGPTDSGHTEDDASGGGVDEEEPLVPASLGGSSGAVVVWDISLEPDEEHTQCKAQLSNASEENESMREEQLGKAGNDDAGHTQAEEDEEENIDQILYIHRQVESPENEDEEYAKMESLNLTDGAVSEDITRSRRKDGAEEETRMSMSLKTHPEKMDETTTDIKVKEDDNKIHDEDKQDLEAVDSEIKSSTITYHDVTEEGNMRTEEASVQRNDENTVVKCEEVENCAGVLQEATENENKSEEGEKAESHVSVCEQLLEYDIDVKRDTGKEDMMAHRSESDKVEDEEDEEDESILHEREPYEEENMNEAAQNQTIDEKTEQEEDVKTVTEDSQEKDILTEHVTCSKEVTLNAKTELHTAEFTDEEQEDVATKTQTKTREIDDAGAVIDEKSDVTTADVVVNEIVLVERVEEERLTSEENDKKSHMEIACTITSVTVKPEAETGQEVSRELNNIPLRMCEGQVVVSPELNSPTCEETKEGVPEHNNEPQPDENTTQWFLEVGDCKEIQTTQLPEEVESQKPESLQNSGSSSGAGYLPVKEHREQEQESTGDINKEHTEVLHLTDTGLPQETDKPLIEQVIQESGLLFEEEEETFLVHSMKTGIEQDFETHVGLADELDETTTELQDETEELLVEFETDEGLSDSRGADGDVPETTGALEAGEMLGFTDETSKLLDTEAPKMMDTSIFQESADTINSDQKCNMITSLLEEITESGFLEESVEAELKIDGECTIAVQDAEIHMEVTGYELAEDEMQNKNQMKMLNLQLVEIAAEPTEERDKNQNVLTAAFEISNKEMLTDTEAADELMTTEFKAKDLTVTSTEEMIKPVTELGGCYAEEKSISVSEHQDVIDEEILDLWIQAVASEDTDQMKQEGLEPGQQTDTNIEQLNNQVSSMQTEMEKEQLVESNSEESELVNEKEISSLTAESGFLDQSPVTNEWDTQTSETQPLKASTESFQDTYDMLASVSESTDISDISELPTSESKDILMEEAAETEQSDLKREGSITETGFSADSEVTPSDAGRQNQELYESQEKSHREQVELLRKETGSQKDTDTEITDLEMKIDWEDSEEVDATSQISAEKVEKSKAEDECLEITTSDSPAEIKHSESGRPRSGSEVLLEEGIRSEETGSEETETGLHVDSWTESEKLFKLPSLEKPWSRSEVPAEALSELSGAEVLEYPTANSEDLLEVLFLK